MQKLLNQSLRDLSRRRGELLHPVQKFLTPTRRLESGVSKELLNQHPLPLSPRALRSPFLNPRVCNPLSPQVALQFEVEASRPQHQPNLERVVGLPKASLPCKIKLWTVLWLLHLQNLSQKTPLMRRAPSQPVLLLRNLPRAIMAVTSPKGTPALKSAITKEIF